MVIDTSAVLAILFNEPEAEQFEVALETDATRLMSAASVLEAAIVIETRLGEAGGKEFDLFLSTASITVVPVTVAHVAAARQAYRIYGKGRHPAGLNYGDCFAYATAKLSGELLLFKGNDFAQTDIKPWTSAVQPNV
ncbi:MAG TPA: type II toxin-antitoxin system VapC family toxin [Methylomirabilota bacterium]|jgi:ribonuclease VapC|nr:type II toxin-antitoxin system VapC family toxin [Methylomirabilota bacterium]